MKLRIKTLMMLGVIFTVLFIILTTVTRTIILTSFKELEDQSVERIIAEMDTENFPLERTLASLQYKKSKTMWVYHRYF